MVASFLGLFLSWAWVWDSMCRGFGVYDLHDHHDHHHHHHQRHVVPGPQLSSSVFSHGAPHYTVSTFVTNLKGGRDSGTGMGATRKTNHPPTTLRPAPKKQNTAETTLSVCVYIYTYIHIYIYIFSFFWFVFT